MNTRLALLIPVLTLLGCAEGPVQPDPAVLKDLRSRYVLDIEPADAVTALGWWARQADDEAVELNAPEVDGDSVTLVGVVGGMPNPFGVEVEADFPWKPGMASFFLVDPATVEEFADHAGDAGEEHAEDCPFCAREAATKLTSLAIVTFTEGGEPIGIDARGLFGLEKGDTVVVKGKPAQVGELLSVDAESLYIRE